MGLNGDYNLKDAENIHRLLGSIFLDLGHNLIVLAEKDRKNFSFLVNKSTSYEANTW